MNARVYRIIAFNFFMGSMFNIYYIYIKEKSERLNAVRGTPNARRDARRDAKGAQSKRARRSVHIIYTFIEAISMQ